jgi:hypothetical protein
MRKCDVRTPEQALAYIIDCNLATVCDLAMKKSRPKGEFVRQISIAQTAINWMVDMKVDLSGTRAREVVAQGGSVETWATKFMPTV